jgi:hypothetical protein
LPQQADLILDSTETETMKDHDGWTYSKFVKTYPKCADLAVQGTVANTPISDIDGTRSALFFVFGFFYKG